MRRLLGRIVSEAPHEHLRVLLGGMSALDKELAWFEEKTKERDLDLAKARPHVSHFEIKGPSLILFRSIFVD